VIYPELENAGLVGKKSLFEKASITRAARRGIDPALLERSLHCMEYAAQLASTGLDFVFKGGTACQLLVGGAVHRLSIDIDIATNATEREIRQAMISVTARTGGRTYVPADVPRKGLDGVPILMFNISAPTYYPWQKPETMIKLDIVQKTPRYDTAKRRLATFYYESDVEVRTPTVGAMLGDKMSTLGPDTIGIPPDRAVDNVKQFYDVGSLLWLDFAPAEVKKAYQACFRDQARWRNISISAEDALLDLAEWCKVASAMQFVPSGVDSKKRQRIQALSSGVEGFAGYIAKENSLTKRRLREIASRTALVSRLLREDMDEGILFDFVRHPDTYRDAVLKGFGEIEKGMEEVPATERWHIHPKEFKNNPLSMAAWLGYWRPDRLAGLLG